jgi:hypothetical protein
MQKSKLIILIAGSVILLILSTIMFILERDNQAGNTTDPEVGVTNENQLGEEAEPGDEAVTPENDGGQSNDATAGLNGEEEEDLRENAHEAISKSSVNENETDMSEQTLFNHSVLYRTYQMFDEDSLIDEEDIEQDAEWISVELMGWHDHASREYGFDYSDDDFVNYVEEENFLEEDTHTIILLEELAETNENLYKRQLEIHFIKQFIWESIKEDVAAEAGEETDLSDENYQQLFYSFEQEVIEELIENNPSLFEEN